MPTALVIGGGIGGLATALALRRAGVESRVFERAPELREVGAGLTLWCNGIKALRALGVADRVEPLGSAFRRFEVLTPTRELLGFSDWEDYARRFGAPSLCVPRPDLLRALAEAVGPGPVRTGAACTGFAQDDRGVTARFADGREERGDFLVGADGIRSVVRAQLLGPTPPRYAGYTCWRGLAAFEDPGLPPGYGFESWGPGRRFAVLGCGPGRFMWYATRNQPADAPDGAAGRKADVRETFRGWFDPVPRLIEATAGEAILRNDIVDLAPVRRWGEARVTLLGDAAHATTPNFGQGACMAIEDALHLAHALRRNGDLPAALRAYEAARIDRTARIVAQSRRLGEVAQWERPLAVWVRTWISRSGLTRRPTLRMIEEMLAQDPPALG